MVYLHIEDAHLSTNQAHRTVISLTRSTALPLKHATKQLQCIKH